MEKHGGIPEPTLSQWLEGDSNSEVLSLKPPSGNALRVIQINEFIVIEASDWMQLAIDVLKKPGKVRKSTLNKLLDFVGWFAVKGFYADAYATIKGKYTEADNRALSAWMQARLEGKTRRSRYTQFLQAQGCQDGVQYAIWTDYVYQGLFGMKKAEMVKVWELVEGDRTIGRNYIPEPRGLEAVAYCENQVIELFLGDLKQAHDDAIAFARRKFCLVLQ